VIKSRAGGGFLLAIGAFAAIGVSFTVFGGDFATAGPVAPVADKAATDTQLDTWIIEARKVMAQEGIWGSHAGIKRNIIRESGGNPLICNDWDINARNGVPSCGLLQVIPPTFDRWKLPQSAYDRAGVRADADNLTDPIANIVTACNYAMNRYPGKGGIDGINEAY
jgi:hypothetical protein